MNINQVKELTERNNCFHDFRVGGFDVSNDKVIIIFEEDMVTIDNAGSQKARYTIEKFENLVISLDCVVPPYLMEIYFEEDNIVNFVFTNGSVSLKYGDMELEISEK